MLDFLRSITHRVGASPRAQIIGILVLALVAALAVFMIWDYFDDKAAVKQDRAIAKAETLEQTGRADRQAGVEKRTRDEAIAEQQQELKGVIDDAKIYGRNADDALADKLREPAR